LRHDEAYSPLVKRLHLARAYLRRRPIWCGWQVTCRCDFRCAFCDFWGRDGDGDELSVDAFARGARKLAGIGSLIINLAGGEPMRRRDIVEIVREVSRYHLTLITTNGWGVTHENARALFEAGLWVASVSIDYAGAARHDARRGVRGAFERAVNALKTLSDARVDPRQRVNVQTVLLEDNLDEIPKLAALARKHDANLMLQPYCVLKTGALQYVDRGTVSRRLLQIKTRFPNFRSSRVFLERFDEARTRGVPDCMAGRAFFNIDAFGRVAKCVEDRAHPVGSILTDDVDALMKGLRAANRANTCRDCWYACRGEIEAVYSLRGLLGVLPTYFCGLMGRNRPK